MQRCTTTFLLSALLLIGVAVSRPAQAVPCDPTIDDCGTGTLDFTYDSFTATSQGFSFNLATVNRINFSVYACLDSAASCNTHPTTDALYWKNLGGGIDDTLPKVFSYNGLRPNTSYGKISLRVSDPPSVSTPRARTVEIGSFITHPAFTPLTVSATNLQPTQATISWTTAFAGSAQVVYGLQPPLWSQEANTIPAGDAIIAIGSAGKTDAWAATILGKMIRRTNGVWQAPLSPDVGGRGLRALDMVQSNNGWAVGLANSVSPIILHMTDGVSWNTVAAPSGLNKNLYSVYGATSTTAWITGESQKIFFYNGSGWVDRTPPSAQLSDAYYQIYSPNDSLVLAVGLNGSIVRSVNNGATWTSPSLPGVASTELTSIASVDGQTIWVGGRGGKLWKSTDAGVSWTAQTFFPSDDIWDLAITDNSHLWISFTRSLGFYDGVAFTSDTSIYSQTGTISHGFLPMNNNDLLIASGPSTFEFTLFGSAINGPISTTPSIQLTGLSTALPPGVKYHYAGVSTSGNISSAAYGGQLNLPLPDAVPPTVNFTIPNATTVYTKTAPFTASGSAQDNTGLASVAVTVNGVAQAVTTSPDTATSPTTTNWSTPFTLTSGANVIVVTAMDTSNNTATQTRTVFLDTQAPTVSIAAPTNGSTQNIVPIALNGTATDAVGVANMDYQLNGGAVITIPAPTGGSGNWTSTIPSPIPGTNTVTVHAYDRAGNVAVANTSFTYAAPTFTLSASPSTAQTGPIGQTFNYTITGTSVNNFSGAVSLATSSSPSGLVASVGTPTITLTAGGTATSTVAITTDGLNPGTYTLTATGTSGTKTATTTMTMTLITAPNFTLSASVNNPPPDIIAGDGVSYTVSAAANDTFTGVVTLSLSGQPAGVSVAFSPTSLSLTPNSSSTGQLSLTTSASTVPGSYSFIIAGVAGSIRQETTVVLNITPPPDFAVQMSPASQTVIAGSPATFYGGSIQSLNNFTGLVDLAVTIAGSPAGITPVLSRTSVQVPSGGKGSFILNVQADHQVAGGTYVVTITGSATIGGRTVTNPTTVNLQVTEDGTAPTISSIQASPNYAEVTITWLTDEPTDGSVTIYTDSALTQAIGTQGAGAACSTLPCTHSVNYTNLAQSPTTYYYSVTSRDIAPARNSTTVTQQGGAPLQFTTLPAPDTTAPVLDVTSPAASSVPTSIIGQVAITGTATDNQGMAQVVITIAAQAGSWTGITIPRSCSGLSCSFSYTWTTDQSVPNGVYRISITATDAAGNAAPTVVRSVDVSNDFTAPQVLSGPTVVVSQTCTSASCTAILTWTTDDASTSEVEYNTSIPYCTSSNSATCQIQVDDNANGNSAALQTSHQITLRNLEPNQIYHYRITSCNGNRVCTN